MLTSFSITFSSSIFVIDSCASGPFMRSSREARPAVFLDRDGTINARAPEHDYIRAVSDFRWLPAALEGMVRLGHLGLPVIVVSNQRGVSRGLVSWATVRAIEDRIQEDLGVHGCRVEAFRYCVHDLHENCQCRKPRPGLLVSAARAMRLDLPNSWMIGDTEADVEAGRAAGCQTILLTTDTLVPQLTARSLTDAANIVSAARGAPQPRVPSLSAGQGAG
jgi:D-glycero-D-manno-heptose 1,7-bisphosphate phosphatase